METAVAAQIRVGDATSAPLHMSFDEFLRREHPGIAEWVKGEVTLMAVKNEHQRIVDFLMQVIGFYLRMMRLGILCSAPFVMRATPVGPGCEPDLFVVTSDRMSRLTSDQLNGPADLVVEVILDESVSRDRSDKFYEYQDAGVREYWLIDSRPNRQRADFYILDANGRYRPIPVADDGIYRSTVLSGFWLDVSWLWVEEPDVLKATTRIIGKDKFTQAIRAPD